jgi:exodeoxyribonuclease V beta subunit
MSFPALPVFEVELNGVQLVEASAGTGKTWTLCALLLRLLLERELPLQQVLVVTFTKAATAELRERVRARLAETRAALDQAPAPGGDPFVPSLLERLREQGRSEQRLRDLLDLALQGFDEAAIFTIHGFAQRSLAELGFAAGLATKLEALTDEGPLRLEIAQAWWRQELVPLGRQSPALLAWLQANQDSPDSWAEALGRHLRLPLAEAVWPDEARPQPELTAAAHAAFEAARATWQAQRDSLRAELFAALPDLNGQSYKPASLDEALAEWDRLLSASDALHADASGKRLPLLRADTLETKTKKGKAGPPPRLFYGHAATLLDSLQAMEGQLEAEARALRCRWLREGAVRLVELKAARGLLGYDDMLLQLAQRLQEPAALALLQSRFPAALIDEFQDTDPLQYQVFEQLFRREGASCFFVGDPKQAVYRFRQADLPTYLAARDGADAVWTLTQNQRSQPPLLDGLNALFGARPDAFLQPGLAYQPVTAGARPKPPLHEAVTTAPLQLWSWAPDEDDEGKPSWPKAIEARRRALQATAADIARRLRSDRLGERPLQPGDIAVLVRNNAQAAWVFDALRGVGVDAVALSQASVWQSFEARELQQILQALLGPAREGLQRAALATVLMGVDAAGLLALDLDAWRARWQSWRQLARELPLPALLQRWMSEAGVAPRLLALPQGERRMTNLLHLIELLPALPPAELLAWLQRQRHGGAGGEDAQLRLESDAARVAIVTVHRSKGLEYPLVYHPFAFEGRRTREAPGLWGRLRRDADGRQLIDYRGEALDDAAKAELAREEAAEELRLHYVALTRAVQRCLLVVGPYRVGNNKLPMAAPIHALLAGTELLAKGFDAGALQDDWARLAQQPHTGWRLLSLEDLQAEGLPPAAARTLSAQTAPARLPPLRWIGSFSRLVEPLHTASSVGDPPEPLAADDFLRFPRGSVAGDCLHAALERADLGDPATWPAAIAEALQQHPPAVDAEPMWPEQLHQALQAAASTPLQGLGGVPLSTLPATRQIREWAFHLHAPQLDLLRLQALLREHGIALPGLRITQLRGYLRGFVDLVFEHQGRFWLADWKSNHLGYTAADYAPAGLAPTIAQHGYALQTLIYQLALHRHLRSSLRGYRPEQHLGGAVLLFVRGLPLGQGQHWQPADPRLLAQIDGLMS